MRITEILTESQLEQLDEGPMLNKFGAAEFFNAEVPARSAVPL